MDTKRDPRSASSLMGAATAEALRIAHRSQQIVSDIVGDEGPEGKIKQRVVMATGNPQFAELLRFCHNPIEAGIAAIRKGANLYTDINMVRVGISKDIARFGGNIICALPESGNVTDGELTRASSGLSQLGKHLTDSIVVIGNAPSAALTVAKMVHDGIEPALLVATPVGFVNAAESKEQIRQLKIPSITSVGTQGGTPVAVAVANELISMSLRYTG
ncbi:MAG TPA: precorrin-8X methylmutase [Candidatus Bathyarchaeia archaeon]|nr:precorrin-8X methylmutase [Candidatus Bathyarchaeia archaeon]